MTQLNQITQTELLLKGLRLLQRQRVLTNASLLRLIRELSNHNRSRLIDDVKSFLNFIVILLHLLNVLSNPHFESQLQFHYVVLVHKLQERSDCIISELEHPTSVLYRVCIFE